MAGVSGVATNLLGRKVEWSGTEGHATGEVVGVASNEGRFILLVAISGKRLQHVSATSVRLA